MAANEDEAEARFKQMEATASLVAPVVASLRNLSKDQTEELILFLKDLQNPPDPVEQEADGMMQFQPKLEALKNSPEQLRLQKMAYSVCWWAIACGAGAGICVTLAVIVVLITQVWIFPALLLIPTIFLLMKAEKLGLRGILISKEQDRKYFLSSMRAARCVSEL